MKNNPKSARGLLRLKAEEKLKEHQKTAKNTAISEAENLKLIHELQVHQIELEMQNEELILAKEQVDLLNDKYIHLYDFAPSGYLTLSKEAKIIELNFCAASLLCKDRSALIKSRFEVFISIETHSIFRSFFEEMLKNNGKEKCEVILKIGSNLPLYIHLVGIFEESSEQCFLTLSNVTERKEAGLIIDKQNKELKKLIVDKDNFMSILGHDLRSPFVSILGFSQLLLKNVHQYDIQKINTYASYIHQSSKKGFKLLEDLLLWANTQSGKIIFSPQKLNFQTVFTEVVETLTPIANAKNITLSCSDKINLTIFADTNMLQTILRNLISNAIKFTNQGGKINVSVIKKESSATISVADNGIGIDAKSLKKIFNISEMHSTKGTSDEDGSGLGLLLCKEFVKLHGGNIWVESELGKGSTFHFTINQMSTLHLQKNKMEALKKIDFF
jgi:signal transduction histidine kinase